MSTDYASDVDTLAIVAAGGHVPMAHRLNALDWHKRATAAEREAEFLRGRLSAVTADLKSAVDGSEARRLRLHDAERQLGAVRDAALAVSLTDETDIAALVKQCDVHRAEIDRLTLALSAAEEGR